LRDLVKTGDPELKIGALRAYIRIARQFVIPAPQRMVMFKEIMTLAQRDDERRLALDILRQILTTESLATAVGYLDQPKLCDTAASVAIGISERIVTIRPKQVATAMTQVLERCRNQGLQEKVRALLTRAEKK
jgi:hypothetical protein